MLKQYINRNKTGYDNMECLYGPRFEKLVDDARVGQCGGVSDLALAKRHLAQQPAHDLAGASLGQAHRVLHYVWCCECANPAAHELLQ